jgi:hypothetical protein
MRGKDCSQFPSILVATFAILPIMQQVLVFMHLVTAWYLTVVARALVFQVFAVSGLPPVAVALTGSELQFLQ